MKDRVIYIDLLRIYLCVAILLYHMGILKGGYLAVCSFFVLSGYLSAQSLNKEKFSILAYYKSRLLRVYAPMVFVVLISLAVCLVLIPDLLWVSMKQEVSSVLFGNNNFWQLSANMDYFARHIDSPYMHLWYVAILLQLELIFPLIYAILRFFKDRGERALPVMIFWAIAACSITDFVFVNITDSLMPAYYNTFTRCFAWFAGIAVGYCHVSGRPLVFKKIEGKLVAKIFLLVLVAAQAVLYVMVPADSKWYMYAMIGTTLVMCRMLDYAKVAKDNTPGILRKIIEYISGISYEIFLVQYPVIFILEKFTLTTTLKYILIPVITVVLAGLINLALHPPKKMVVMKVVAALLFMVLLAGVGYGNYRYMIAPDLKAEQERMEQEMIELQKEQLLGQKEYEKNMRLEAEQEKQAEKERIENVQSEKADLDSQISELELQIQNIEETVSELSITFIGDSVLLGAVDALYETFSNCYIDAEIGRTAYTIDPILQELKNRNMLGEIVVINCGANGDCSEEFKDIIMNTLSDRQVFWCTCTNNPRANEDIIEYAQNHDNLHVVDWATASSGHGEYFAGDGIHLAAPGRVAYAETVMDAICSYYVEGLEAQLAELQAQRQELEEEDITGKPSE